MTTVDSIITTFHKLLTQEIPPLLDLRKALLEIEEFLTTTEFLDLSNETRDQIQTMRLELKTRIRAVESQETLHDRENSDVSEADLPTVAPTISKPNLSKTRAMQAEKQMEDAEKLFYGGRYSEAIKLYDNILKSEPGWERARQHRSESENYLRTGYIPPVALPAEAASAFGKAQSAARVGRFEDALAMLSKAQSVLRELGIQRWQEGLEFEQKLQENIDAENAYNEGLHHFEQGKIEEAIERIETAARATGLPKYDDRAQLLRKIKETIRQNNETLSNPDLDPKIVTQVKSDLDILIGEYGDNPAFQRLRTRLEASIPGAVFPLKEQARAIKAQAERAATLDETQYLARQANNQLNQIRSLIGLDENLDYLQNEVDKLLREVARYQDELNQARVIYENNKRWPSRAAKLSQAVCQRFPNDPEVIRLKHSLATFIIFQSLIRLGIIFVVLAGIVVFIWWTAGRIKEYTISLTPSSTPTYTITATTTPLPTDTATPTLTPTSTSTPTPTSTPILAVALRDIWARSGCYEGFNAIGRIPVTGMLRFLPDERRFDQFNRECVLVEYQGPERSIIGWVLIMDAGSAPQTPIP